MLNARIASAGLSAFCIAGIGALAPCALLQHATAQSPDAGGAATAPAAEPYIAVVTADGVYVRSAPSVQSSYPFGKLKRGDLVLMEPVADPARLREGTIVSALVPGSGTTLKHFHRSGHRVRLEAANPAYEAIVVDADQVTIQGRLVAVWRQARPAAV